jgi:hypothetical protein
MILALLVLLLGLYIIKKTPELRRKLRDRRLEADYFRRISRR